MKNRNIIVFGASGVGKTTTILRSDIPKGMKYINAGSILNKHNKGTFTQNQKTITKKIIKESMKSNLIIDAHNIIMENGHTNKVPLIFFEMMKIGIIVSIIDNPRSIKFKIEHDNDKVRDKNTLLQIINEQNNCLTFSRSISRHLGVENIILPSGNHHKLTKIINRIYDI